MYLIQFNFSSDNRFYEKGVDEAHKNEALQSFGATKIQKGRNSFRKKIFGFLENSVLLKKIN